MTHNEKYNFQLLDYRLRCSRAYIEIDQFWSKRAKCAQEEPGYWLLPLIIQQPMIGLN